jgi:gliding motility-associated-like protein
MKRFIVYLLAFFIALSFKARADHITGGEMFYSFAGKSGTDNKYNVTLKLYMRCNSGRRFNDPTTIAIFDKSTNQKIQEIPVPLAEQSTISLNNQNPCITNPPAVCYVIGFYQFSIVLPPNAGGYLIVGQVNFRIADINNFILGYSQVGATYTSEIPGNAILSNAPENNSAHFTGNDLVVICANNPFSYSFAAADADGDELRYSFCNAYQSGTSGANAVPPPPPYDPVPYGQGFTGTSPLGNNITLNTQTGLITGIAPSAGIYVITVCVQEIRHGNVIATQRKDLQINIAECTIASASLLPEYLLCRNSNSLTISNLSNSPLINSYNWQFSNSSGNIIFSSSSASPTVNFPDTGIYKVTLSINSGQSCTGTASSLIKVYPGQTTDFSSEGICVDKPTSFIDNSKTVYGFLKSWLWNFGDPNTTLDTSNKQNPSYTHTETGPKLIQLIVTTSTGCKDSVKKVVNIVDKPPIAFNFRDTLICNGDSIQIKAIGSGIFTWSTSTGIFNSNSPSVLVHPEKTTNYIVSLNDNGCINNDSLKVNVVNFVALKANNDTIICANDPASLTCITNGLSINWSPVRGIEDPFSLNTLARPDTTTTYNIVSTIGHCSATARVNVKVVPLPTVNAGVDTIICFQSVARLHGATNGNKFNWSPVSLVSDSNSLELSVHPPESMYFVLSATDNKGCPKTVSDSVFIRMLPQVKAFAGNDTSIILGQPLQLNASGGVRYQWSPAFNLSSTTINNPMATFYEPVDTVIYKVLVYDEAGCHDSSFIAIRVFQSEPIIFVPNAFTPGNDGKNDILRPIAAGMTKIEYFRIYNRWGRLIFETTQNNKGWDGSINGSPQGTQSYVWEVKATDYKGLSYFQKGTVTLIR